MNKRCTNPSCRKTFSTLYFSGSCPHCQKEYPQIAASPRFFRVRILDLGLRKVKVIKSIREIYKIGLREAKEVADQVPNTVFILNTEEAYRFVHDFAETGVIYEMKGTSARKKSILCPD